MKQNKTNYGKILLVMHFKTERAENACNYAQLYFSVIQQWAETDAMRNSKPFQMRGSRPQRESDEKCSPTLLLRDVWPSWRCSCLYCRFPSQTALLSLWVTNRKSTGSEHITKCYLIYKWVSHIVWHSNCSVWPNIYKWHCSRSE